MYTNQDMFIHMLVWNVDVIFFGVLVRAINKLCLTNESSYSGYMEITSNFSLEFFVRNYERNV